MFTPIPAYAPVTSLPSSPGQMHADYAHCFKTKILIESSKLYGSFISQLDLFFQCMSTCKIYTVRIFHLFVQ